MAQMVGDISAEAERVIEVNGEKAPAIVFIFRTMAQAAATGNIAAARQFLALHSLAISETKEQRIRERDRQIREWERTHPAEFVKELRARLEGETHPPNEDVEDDDF